MKSERDAVRPTPEREPRGRGRAERSLGRAALFAIAVASITLATTTASGDGLTIDPAVTNARAKLKARVFAQEEGLKRRARVAGYRLLIKDLKAEPRLTTGEREDSAALIRLLATETERSKR